MKALKVLGIIGSVILTMLFFIGTLTMLVLGIVFSSVSSDGIKEHVESLDILNTQFSRDSDNTFKDEIIKSIEEEGIDSELAKDILDNENITTEVNTYMSDILLATIYGEKVPQVDTDKIFGYLEDDNIKLSYEDKSNIKKVCNEIDEWSLEFINDNNSEFKSNPDGVKMLDNFGTIAKIILIIATVLFTLFVGLMTWSYYKPFIFLAVPSLLTGITLLLIGLGKTGIIDALADNAKAGSSVISKMVEPIFNRIQAFGFTYLVIGIISILLFIILGKVSKNHKKTIGELNEVLS